MNEAPPPPERRGRSVAWLLILPGATILGTAVGLFVGDPGFGLMAGFGAGMLMWGLIVAVRSSPTGGRW